MSEIWKLWAAIPPSPTPTAPQEADALREALTRLEVAVDWHLGRSGFTQSEHLKGVEHGARVRRALYEAHDAARAALARNPRRNEMSKLNIPAGWALVPVEVTQEIVEAFAATGGHHPNQRWPALLAAAPTPPVDAALGEPVAQLVEEAKGIVRRAPVLLEAARLVDIINILAAPVASRAVQAEPVRPIDMVLHCPACGLQHIDAPEVSACGVNEHGNCNCSVHKLWHNPPHRSHLCHGCGHVWRPADVRTNGVQAVHTRGKADSPTAPAATAEPSSRTASAAPRDEIDEVTGAPWQLLEMARRVSAAYRDGTLSGYEIRYLDDMIERAEKLPTAARDVLMERRRQVSSEGWTPSHDDDHRDGELSYAAAGYACSASDAINAIEHELDGQGEPTFDDAAELAAGRPWPAFWDFKAAPPRRQLVKAGALILAEIERLDRLGTGLPQTPTGQPCRRAEATQAILALVGLEPSLATIAGWSSEQDDEAVAWASATHLRASDNDVDVPLRPQFLPDPWKGPYNDTGDVFGGPTPTPF